LSFWGFGFATHHRAGAGPADHRAVEEAEDPRAAREQAALLKRITDSLGFAGLLKVLRR
jgi:hypothetical protein